MKFIDCIEIVGNRPISFEGEKRYISTGAIDINHIDEDAVEIITYDERPSRADLSVCSGDVIFAKMAGTKKNMVIDETTEENIYSTGFFAVRGKEKVITARCLYYLVGSELFLKQKDKHSSGATQRAITNKGLENINISIPKLSEQGRIVSQLDSVASIIEKRKKELELLDDLIKARFVEMFGDININDKNWNCVPLGELCNIVRGASPRPIEQFLGGDIPWIKIGDATDGDNIYLSSTKEHIIQEGVKKSRLVKAGSLIFANCGVSLGFARIITFDGCIHDGWLAMEDIDERLDKVFLLQTLNQMTEHFRVIAPAGTQPNLNTSIMKAYMQVIPPIELQREFICFADQVDKSKAAVQKMIDEAQTLFDSLMQEYFG